MSPRATVLVADDDVRILKALTLRFGQIGLEVITATDGYTALSLAAQHKPSVMVLDVNMPAGDGFSVQERVNGIKGVANIPVIYMTGDKSMRLDEMAEKLGAFALLHKPFQIEQLIDAVLSALSPPRMAG